MEYKSITFDMNQPIAQQITEPLNSAYGVAVKVYKDGQLVSADLSVDGTVCTEGPDGWQFAELSSGNVETMKTIEVTASKEVEGETFENTVSAKQPLANREVVITTQLGTFLEGTEIAPNNIAEFEMSSSLTPNAGGDPITETYSLDDNVQFYGRLPSTTTNLWWHIEDGKWFDQAKTYSSDTIVLGVIGTRNIQAKSKKLYPQSTGTATYKLVFKFGEDISVKFPFYVVEKDLGYFEK